MNLHLISIIAYNLMPYGIIRNIIIILELVYWLLYKIVKEYSWNNFNKLEGFIFAINKKRNKLVREVDKSKSNLIF